MPLFKKRPKPVALESFAHLEELAGSGRPLLVDFFQYGCRPCQIMDGIVNELAEELEGTAVVAKANAAHVPEVFDRLKVRSTPTFVVFTRREGSTALTQRWRASGLVKKDALARAVTSATGRA